MPLGSIVVSNFEWWRVAFCSTEKESERQENWSIVQRVNILWWNTTPLVATIQRRTEFNMKRSITIPITLQNFKKNKYSIAKRKQTVKIICKSSCHCPLLRYPSSCLHSFGELFCEQFSFFDPVEFGKIKRNKWRTELKKEKSQYKFCGFFNEISVFDWMKNDDVIEPNRIC